MWMHLITKKNYLQNIFTELSKIMETVFISLQFNNITEKV